MATSPAPKWTIPGLCVLLAVMVWMVFGQTRLHGFVNYDDDMNVYKNPAVIRGLSLRGIAWAFSHTQVGHWDPLTTISHMLDCQLFGLRAGGHHLVNVLLHGLAAILLFLVLREMTGFPWRSAFVAAVFAVHPLRAESVAWVTERKDVLSGVFFMLTLAAYVRFTRKPQSRAWYGAAILLFALGLASKSMLVTLPFVLLLLDYWPLGRLAKQGAGVRQLILEKAPFFALSLAASAAQLVADREGITSTNKLPLLTSVGNAAVSYVTYILEMIFPRDLAVAYPFDANLFPVWKVLPALVALAAISAGVFAWRRQRPYLLTGWLWYLGMLVPVIGLLQAGMQSHADRYTYLPQIGLSIAVAWLAANVCGRLPNGRWILGIAGSTTLAALMWLAWIQTSYWQDNQTLWNHALAVTTGNAVAHNNLGLDLQDRGHRAEALAHFQEAIAILPGYPEAHNSLGTILIQMGNTSEAIVQFQKALAIKPLYAEAENNLGNVFFQTGDMDQAIAHYQKAVAIKPDYSHALVNLGNALVQKGETETGIAEYKMALQIDPGDAGAHYGLGVVLMQTGPPDEAVRHFQETLKTDPRNPDAQCHLAWLLATCPQASIRDGARALDLAQQADRSTGGNRPDVLCTLAAAYAESGQFSAAVDTARRALDLANSQSDAALAGVLRSQVALYQDNTPFRDESPAK